MSQHLCRLGFVLALLSACSPRPGILSIWPAPPPSGTLTVRLRQDVDLLNPLREDPSTQQIAPLVFAGLVKLDGHLRVQPDLAQQWEVTSDGLVWTFRLHPRLRWHDDTLLTADDVAFTLGLHLDDRFTRGRQTGIQQVVEDVTALNSDTVRVALRRPFSPLLAEMTIPILPRHLLANAADPTRVDLAVGSGPFRLASRQPGQSILLSANPSYHGPAPRLREVLFKIIPDEREASLALATGEVLLSEVDLETAADPPANLRHSRFVEFGYNYVGFNLREGRLFADRNLRLAFAHAIDKETVVAASTGGRGIPIWSHIPPASWAYDASVPKVERDVSKGRELLAASGWQDTDGDGIVEQAGNPLAFDLLVRDDDPERVAAARLLSQEIRAVGMNARVRPVPFQTELAARRLPPFDFEAMIMGWDLGLDPDDYYLFASGQMPSADRPNLLNYVGFRHPEFNTLSIQARTTLDYEKRSSLYAHTQRIIAAELPYYLLWARQYHLLSSRRLQGPLYLDSPNYLWNAAEWYVAR